MKAKPDCIGQKFGRLTVVEKIPQTCKGSRTMWRVRCDCGTEFECRRDRFDRGIKMPSCGCYKLDRCAELGKAKRLEDCTGKRFGRLTVLGISRKKIRELLAWDLLCDCGKTVTMIRGDFDKKLGNKSCGCSSTLLKKQNAGVKTQDLSGLIFGELTVLKTVRGWNVEGDRIRSSNECLCNCGAIVWRASAQLKSSKFLNCRGTHHLVGPKFPPMPTPMPDRVAQIVQKYYHFVKSDRYNHVRSDIQDEKVARLERVAWIIAYRESFGEVFSEQYLKNYILKWILPSGRAIAHKHKNLRSGVYTERVRKLTGGEMPNPSFYDAVFAKDEKTQQEALLSKPKKRSFLRR